MHRLRQVGAQLPVGRRREERPECVGEELFGHFCCGQYKICEARCDRAAGHAAILRRFHLLHHDHTRLAIDGLQAKRPIRACAREDDADGLVPLVRGQRAQEVINGQMRRCLLLHIHAVQHAAENSEGAARRVDIDTVRLDLQPIRCHQHWDAGDLAQQLRQEAGVPWMLVRDDDEGHAGVSRYVGEQFAQRLQPARRSPDADDGKTAVIYADGGWRGGSLHGCFTCGWFLGAQRLCGIFW